jgi:ABC-type bacteriocin/lantibiotic exporter with double-glycine peptidase domain
MFLNLLSVREKAQLSLLIAAMIGTAFIEAASVASIMPFIAVVEQPDVVRTNEWMRLVFEFFEFTDVRSFLFSLGLVVLGLLVIGNLFKGLTRWLTLRYTNKLYVKLSRQLLAHYMARPYAFFLDRSSTDLGKNILQEIRTVTTQVLGPAMTGVSQSLVCLFLVAVLVTIDPLVAIVIIAVLGGTHVGIYLLVKRKLTNISQEQIVANSAKFKAASEALHGIKDLKLLHRERVFLERFTEPATVHARNNVTAGIIADLPRYGMEVVAFGGILVMVLYLLRADQDSTRVISVLALYALAGYRLLPAVQNAFASVVTVRANWGALMVLHRDLANDNQSDTERARFRPQEASPLTFTRQLELKGVEFSYSSSRKPVLDGLDLTIPYHASVGLVGPTGSGKTTLVDVILGLLAPNSGELRVDGVDLKGQDLVRWQRNLGYVPQHIFLCDDTVARNIAFGVPDSEIDMAAVVRSAATANLHAFVRDELPRGYETVVGEQGVRLSGGQRQRIGIARALYRDPAVLIMDEATSALDGVTEEAVVEALRTLSGKKTILMIAHRLTTVRECDVIYLVADGRIISRGTHDELMKTSAWYKAAARVS